MKHLADVLEILAEEYGMKIKSDKFSYMFTIIILLEVNFFCIFRLPNIYYNFNSHFHKVITLVLTIFLFIVALLNKGVNKRVQNFYKFIVFFLISWLIIYFYSVYRYNDTNLKGAFFDYYYYFILLLYFYISYKCIDNDKNFEKIQKIIINIAMFYSILMIIQYFFLKYEIRFLAFHNNFLAYTSGRLTAGFELVLFSSVFLCANLFSTNKKQRIKSKVLIVIEIIYLTFVVDSRSSVIIYLAIIYFSIFINIKAIRPRKVFIMLGGIIAAVSLWLSSSALVQFFLSTRPSSFRQRLREIAFYSEKIFYNKFIGIGFLRDLPDSYNYKILHGSGHSYFVSDIGILGFFAIWGVIGICLTVYFIIICISIIKKTSIKYGKYHDLYVCVLLYLIGTSINLCAFDVQRIVYLPISLAVLDCCVKRMNCKIKLFKNKKYRIFLIKNQTNMK